MSEKVKKKKHPSFQRSNYGRKDRKRVKDNWRKPRGIDNKKRMKLKSAGARPGPGWRNARAVRGLHPTGFQEAIVYVASDLETLDGKKQAARISASVGKKKRELILESARQKGIKVLNE